MEILGYAALAPKATLQKFKYTTPALTPWQIEVAISHCGICHSDVHLVDNDWNTNQYPLVPGHEIVGTIVNCGTEVTHLKKGQRVGIGWQASACLSCEYCIRGEERLCEKRTATCVGQYGGFAEKIIADSRFAFAIPENLDSAQAAPLMCGGATVYTPIRQYVHPSMKVGVVGIGGLGHLALQFLRAYGCEVTAFSTTPEKETEAKKLGAHHFIVSSDINAMKKSVHTLDFILSTVHVNLDWNLFLNCVKPLGKLCFVGAMPQSIQLNPIELVVNSKTTCGSNIGSRHTIEEMLMFAARHNIQAKIETLPMIDVNTALEKVRNNQARYRMVLSNR